MKWIVVALLFVTFLYGPSAVRSYVEEKYAKDISSPPVTLNSEKLFRIVNQWRTEKNKTRYIKSESLCVIAEERAHQITTDFSHDLFTKIEYPSTLSENIVMTVSEEAALYQWEGSKPHREALERPYKYSCIATEGSYAVQIFSNCENGCP